MPSGTTYTTPTKLNVTGSFSMSFADVRRFLLTRYGNVGKWRRQVRKTLSERGISQAAVARRAGLDRRDVSRWLTGRITPELKSMLILDEAIEELVEGR